MKLSSISAKKTLQIELVSNLGPAKSKSSWTNKPTWFRQSREEYTHREKIYRGTPRKQIVCACRIPLNSGMKTHFRSKKAGQSLIGIFFFHVKRILILRNSQKDLGDWLIYFLLESPQNLIFKIKLNKRVGISNHSIQPQHTNKISCMKKKQKKTYSNNNFKQSFDKNNNHNTLLRAVYFYPNAMIRVNPYFLSG